MLDCEYVKERFRELNNNTMTFPGTDKLLDGITYDGLHPNAKGYAVKIC